MIKNIINQQKAERDILLGQDYINRVSDIVIQDYRNSHLIKLITGPRRAGKSVLALQMLKGQNFAYLNFDDDLLLKNFDEDAVMQSLNEIYNGYNFLLLDEIQNLYEWELWVNKLFRRGANLIITGSNAKLLSRELATSLTGRYIQIAVFPFGFSEVLQFNKILFPTAQNEATPQQTGEILSCLNNYLQQGGFPETVLNPAILKNYLSTLFDSILLKDILKRFQIRQTQQIYDLAYYFLSNYTNPYTANQLKEHLNFGSVATVLKFIGYLEEPYLFLNLPRYDAKIKAQKKSQKKSYVIDNGFVKARSFELSANFGRLLENLVFVELLRRNYEPGLTLFYYRTRKNKEVDFLCRIGHSVERLIQVCYDVTNNKTFRRETDALIEASTELNCSNLLLITWDSEKIIDSNGFSIQLVPAYKWLLTSVLE